MRIDTLFFKRYKLKENRYSRAYRLSEIESSLLDDEMSRKYLYRFHKFIMFGQ